MKFCSNCGKKIVITQNQHGKNNAFAYRCLKCGFTVDDSENTHDQGVLELNIPEEAIIVLTENELELRTMPTNRVKCLKCDNDLAYVWQVQTRSGDEGPTQFFRCTKCGYTWRLYT